MRKFTFLIATAALAAILAGTARSSIREDCSHNPASAWNTIVFNAGGFRPYLLGIGSPWWKGKERLAAVTIGPSPEALCGDAARKAYALQQHFYILLRAFPQQPTRAQWKARFRPLVQAAIAADADFLTLVRGSLLRDPLNADKAWLVARQFAHLGSPMLN